MYPHTYMYIYIYTHMDTYIYVYMYTLCIHMCTPGHASALVRPLLNLEYKTITELTFENLNFWRYQKYRADFWEYVAVCCSVLQCVAVCYSLLSCVAVCYSVLQCVAVYCSVLHLEMLFLFFVLTSLWDIRTSQLDTKLTKNTILKTAPEFFYYT